MLQILGTKLISEIIPFGIGSDCHCIWSLSVGQMFCRGVFLLSWLSSHTPGIINLLLSRLQLQRCTSLFLFRSTLWLVTFLCAWYRSARSTLVHKKLKSSDFPISTWQLECVFYAEYLLLDIKYSSVEKGIVNLQFEKTYTVLVYSIFLFDKRRVLLSVSQQKKIKKRERLIHLTISNRSYTKNIEYDTDTQNNTILCV